jgi:nitroreductase
MDYRELIQLFQKRVSVRTYLERDVSDKDIGKLVEGARWAPTSCNRQSWKVVIIRKGTKAFDLLASANFGGVGFAKHAPVLLLIVVDLRSYGIPREMNFPVNDGSIVGSYLMLLATSLGLDTCWVSWQASLKRKKQVYKELKLRTYFFPICVLTLGYCKGSVDPTPRDEANYYIASEQ